MRFRRSSQIELSPIKEIELAAARVPGAVSLAQGIPSFDTPEVIKEYVKEKLDQGETARYSLAPGLPELRELVAESLLGEGMRYDPEGEIVVTAGSIEAISATLLALTEPGDEVILPSPCYASYQQVIRMAGCVPKFAALDEERNFDLDVESIARLITPRTAAIFYCNPNNPTGTIYSRAQSLRMMELAETHDLMIITDEVYKDFIFNEEPYFSPAQVEAFRERVVRIYSLSKAYAMTGWRVGYLHSSREAVAEILKVHDALVTCAPVISQHAAVAALAYGGEAIAEFKAAYRRRRDLTLQHLDELSHIFDYQKPNGAYFVFPRVKDPVPFSADSRRLALDMLERARVAVVPGSAFGPTGESHLRMSFGREEGDIEEAFRRMRGYFGRDGSGAVYPFPAAQAAPRPRRGVFRRRTRGLAIGYLSLLARFYLWRRKPRVVAIAGNRGKTVFKRTLTGLLERRYAVRANPRSYNTEIGLPLAVLGLEIDPRDWKAVLGTLTAATLRALFSREPLEMLVLEFGARQRGDMAELLRTAKPDWAIVTNLTLDSEDDPGELAVIQEEVAGLCRAVPPGRLLLSGDDGLLVPLAAERDPPPLTFSGSRLRQVPGGYQFKGEKDSYMLGGELVGASALYAVEAALLLGEALGMQREALDAFLREYTGKPEGQTRAWEVEAG
ncbi:MAG: aminotransferase class I/II-fold pyridoxal phosphate-dependent enzyme [SAR324 cluster bacterium]|nr:aminotransferase class I/II-fold pyridoxal phosphate-dependent enzyme [SAR324 cluster bacterium]